MTTRFVTLLLLCLPLTSNAAVIFTPSGLPVGAEFRLVFVTSVTTTAFSPDIAFYDNIVQTAAASAGWDSVNGQAVTWGALASTETVSARSRLPNSTIPVFTLTGALVADATHDIWSASILSPISWNEFGQGISVQVWTGSNWNGAALQPPEIPHPISFALGNSYTTYGAPKAIYAWSSNADSRWMRNNDFFVDRNLHLYGFSNPIFVTEAVPEPSSLTLMILGAGGLLIVVSRRAER